MKRRQCEDVYRDSRCLRVSLELVVSLIFELKHINEVWLVEAKYKVKNKCRSNMESNKLSLISRFFS